MSLEVILAAIEAAGQAKLARVQADLDNQLAQIAVEAETAAHAHQAEAARRALVPAGRERARLLHNARLESLRLTGQTRQALVAAALAATQQQLSGMRELPGYPDLLRRLMVEALAALGPEEAEGHPPHVCVDARDEAAARACLSANGSLAHATLEASLDCWGGVIVRSGDGRIVIDNRLEARLERATPILRRVLAAEFERAAADEPPAVKGPPKPAAVE
jgi:vacuolar-type H+-ATPase subunit E/Vma4